MRCLAEIIADVIQKAGFHSGHVTYFHVESALAGFDHIGPSDTKDGTLYVRFDAGHLELVAFLPLIPMAAADLAVAS